MIPSTFAEANKHIGKPADLDESQCGGIDAFVGRLRGGTLDGCPIFVTAWRPTEEDLARLNAGEPVFVTWCTTALAPHTLSTSFAEATSLA